MAATIALLAHDRYLDELVTFVGVHAPLLGRYRLMTTANLGQRLQNTPGLMFEQVLPLNQGGDVQIAAEVVRGNVAAVLFLTDSTTRLSQELEVETLFRVCSLHNVLLATNPATAAAIATHLAQIRVAHLLYNPVSGRSDGGQDLAQIQQFLDPHMHLAIHVLTPETDIAQLVKDAVAARADMVIASGGDGTVSAVANALVGTPVPLGVIPRGTANAFSVALGIPATISPLPPPIQNACQVILAGKTRTIDVARCNDTPMTLLTAIGYEAGMVEKATSELKSRWGALAYLVAGWQQFNEQELFDVEIEADGEIQKFQAGAITVANAAPPTSVLAQGGGHVVFDDGVLDVTIASADTMLQGIQTMFRMFGAALRNSNANLDNLETTELVNNGNPNVVHFQAKRIKITTDPPQKVVLDGEMIGTTPIEIVCIPDGLTVLVP